jgi:hypothetical protein
VVAQYREIANFKATKNNMWIQARRDMGKEWLQLRYCVTKEDVEMAMRDWHDDWRISVPTQEVPKGTEVDMGTTKTSIGDTAVPKKPTKSGKPN